MKYETFPSRLLLYFFGGSEKLLIKAFEKNLSTSLSLSLSLSQLQNQTVTDDRERHFLIGRINLYVYPSPKYHYLVSYFSKLVFGLRIYEKNYGVLKKKIKSEYLNSLIFSFFFVFHPQNP